MKGKYFRLALFLGMVGLILLSACSSGAKPTSTALPTETKLVAPTEGPAPTQASSVVTASDQAYPTPVEQSTQVLAYPPPVVYPTMAVYPSPEGANPGPTGAVVSPVATEPTAASVTTPTSPTPKATRDVNAELSATDPNTVQLASGKPQLVEFFAFWDGTSKAMAPLMHALEADYSGRVNFVYLDIDNPAVNQIKQQLGFKVQPQFFLLDSKGNILKQWSGTVSEADFQAALDAALK